VLVSDSQIWEFLAMNTQMWADSRPQPP